MSNTEEEVETTCDWCLQEVRVQTIDENLWRFWKIISSEDPNMTSHRNICVKCKSRYEGFSIYIERYKINTSRVDELLSIGQVKDEPTIDIEYPPLIKTEISDEVNCNSYCPTVSSGVFNERQMLAGYSNFLSNDSRIDEVLSVGNVKKELITDIEEHLINEEVIWKEEASDPDYPTASGGKGKDGLVLRVTLERLVLPDSMVHQKKVNNDLRCTYCGKTFSFPSALKIHMRTHTGEKPFKCSLCNKSFTRINSLKSHLHTHTGERPFKCSLCNKSFTRIDSLKGHLRTHTGEKPFKCSYCNKSFTWMDSLKDHLRIHTGEKPFICSHCYKSFTRMNSLKRHLHTHTLEKLFKCSLCDKSFTRMDSLKDHLRTHTVEKHFKCSYCNKSFTKSNNLNVHLRTHTGKRPFKCSHCYKSFTQMNTLKGHLRTHAS